VGSLSAWFESLLFRGSGGKAVTIIGSGGKTSLIWHLAVSLADSFRAILVTPTTKMLVPKAAQSTLSQAQFYHRYIDSCREKRIALDPVPGITLAGAFNETSGKLESLPPDVLKSMVSGYDLVLMEGDGSAGLPIKAWAKGEPVVPPFTDLTIGVLPLWPLGKPVSEKLIHRLPLFLALTGAAPGEIIKPEHIALIIMDGLFAKAKGKKILFFNQTESSEALQQAREIAGLLPQQFRKGLSAMIAGSVKENLIVEIDYISNDSVSNI
jgi:probable selenium-dependent hydroxylase accessory protein YqeC